MTGALHFGRRPVPLSLLAVLIAAALGLAVAEGSGGTTPPAAPAVTVLGVVAPAHEVRFDLLLAQPGQTRMARALAALENPASPSFERVIAPGAYGARFGLPARATARLRKRLAAAGVRVLQSFPQRTALTVAAPARTIMRLFGVRLVMARDRAGHRFRLPAGHLTIPRSLTGLVAGVTGLDTQPVQLPHDVPLSGLDPDAAATAYDVGALHQAGYDGQGQTVAIISFSAFDPGDPAAFARQYHLRGPALRIVNVDGGTTDESEVLEANLDIDLVRAIAPAARVLVYEAPNTAAGYTDTINAIVKQGRAPVISSSWGTCELDVRPAQRRADTAALQSAVAAGISMFVASGDQGAYDCQGASYSDLRLSVDWPSSSAYAVGVGGTRLALGPGNAYAGEAAWEDQLSAEGGGGGVSVVDPRPAWQTGPGVLGPWSDGRRQVPDVSADADPGSSWAFYALGDDLTENGTSAAAPFWAGAMALVRQYAQRHRVSRVGFADPIFYALAAEHLRRAPFHDITRGGNRHYPAGTGWDPATGLGTPDVANLAADVTTYLRRHTGRRHPARPHPGRRHHARPHPARPRR